VDAFANVSMSKQLPWKAIFFVGFILGAGIVTAVTFAPGDAGTVSDGVPYGAPDGMNATIEGDTDVIMETDVLFPSSDTVQMRTEAGNITFQSNGPAWATVSTSNITGTYTNITDIDATQNNVTINPEDKSSITVGGDIDRIAFQDATVDDGGIDFVYAGTSGTSTIEVQNLPANTQVAAVDRTHGGVLDVSTTDNSGTVVFTVQNSEHAVELQTTDGGPTLSNLNDDESIRYEDQQLQVDVSDPDFPDDNITLEWYVDGNLVDTTYATYAGTYTTTVGPYADGDHTYSVDATDEYGQTDSTGQNTFTVDHYDPEISDIEPSGDLDSEPTQITAQINDTDFALDGDSLTVTINLDGSQVNQQTIGSNQTVTTSMPSSGQTGGAHDISIEVSDDYGNSESDASSYRVPDTLFVRNETNHTELVAADGEVRFFTENEVFTRSAPNGEVDLDGLPVNQDFIVEVDPTETNYTSRTIYLESIYDQESVYVLNTSQYGTVESRFVLDDPTGQFDSESIVQIERIINISGQTSYQTIIADEFGSEGVTATLQEGQRYEISVIGDSGTQNVGPYRADVSETVEVRPDAPSVNLTSDGTSYQYGAELRNDTLEFAYDDPTGDTTELTVWIYERGNQSHLLQPNQTVFDIGSYSSTVDLSVPESNTEWVVAFVVDRNGETNTHRVSLSNRGDLTPPVGGNWQQIVGVSLLVLFAGAFSVLNARIGAVIVSLVGGILWFIGFLGTAATGASVTIAIFVAVLGYMRGN